MKPATLLRVYPRAWRERYGEELLALIGANDVSTTSAIDIGRQAAAEWRRVSGVDVWLRPILIGGFGFTVGKAMAARVAAPSVIHGLAVIPSVGWAAMSLARSSWVLMARLQGRPMPALMPKLSMTASRAGLATAWVVGACHFWIFPSSFLWTPLAIIGNPAFMIAMFVGMARVVADQPAAKPYRSGPQPPQHPLELG